MIEDASRNLEATRIQLEELISYLLLMKGFYPDALWGNAVTTCEQLLNDIDAIENALRINPIKTTPNFNQIYNQLYIHTFKVLKIALGRTVPFAFSIQLKSNETIH